MPDRPRARFIFILSPERSGSTLLSAMLGGHREILAPPELHLLRYPTLRDWREGYPAAVPSLEGLLEALGVAEPADDCRPLELYVRLLEAAPRGSWLVDKTPAYARNPDALARSAELDARWIWLVRHPLAVAASRIARRRSLRRGYNHVPRSLLRYPGFVAREAWSRLTGSGVRRLTADWAGAHAQIGAFLDGQPGERWHRLHYEELVRTPREHALALCDFLGLDFEPEMLDPRANAPAQLGYGIGDEKLLERDSIDASVADAWRRSYSRARLEPAVAQLAERLGVRL